MKGNMLICAPLCLLSLWLLPISSKKIKLDMVKDAVDDMYFNCNAMMEKMVKEQYFNKENKDNFEIAWKKAEKRANKALNDKDKTDQALTKDHMLAICAYTAENPNIYGEFNKAVRTNRKNYGTSFFPYHSLHFWLTSAVQILNNNTECQNTYRRTKAAFSGSVNKIIRFGTFTSSSLLTNLTHFGNKTCFKIKTCLGGYLKNYSCTKGEQEVLIPPYEMFKITQKTRGTDNLAGCKVVYFLESVGLQSNLNCYAARNSKHSQLSVWRNKLKAGFYSRFSNTWNKMKMKLGKKRAQQTKKYF